MSEIPQLSPGPIRPLHAQILIKPLPIEDSPSALVIMPESAKKSTVQSADGKERINFVLAEVVRVGPGRLRTDGDLIPEIHSWFLDFLSADTPENSLDRVGRLISSARALLKRSQDPSEVIPIDVKPGDKILYHPSVRNFDRSVIIDGVEHFIIGEHSLLAVVEGKS